MDEPDAQSQRLYALAATEEEILVSEALPYSLSKMSILGAVLGT